MNQILGIQLNIEEPENEKKAKSQNAMYEEKLNPINFADESSISIPY